MRFTFEEEVTGHFETQGETKMNDELLRQVEELQAKVAEQEKRIKAIEERLDPPQTPRYFSPDIRKQ